MTEQKHCEDAVSRADLLKKFEDWFIELQKAHRTDEQLGVNWCINTLKGEPPVTPKGVTVTDFADKCRECGRLKKGKWIIIDDCEKFIAKCSECGQHPLRDGYGQEVLSDYCPNCGTRMECDE